MVMTSDTNNSTLPEKSTNHYFDSITGQEIITDSVSYLNEALAKPNVYGFSFGRYLDEYSLRIIIPFHGAAAAILAEGEVERLIKYITENHSTLEDAYKLRPIDVARFSSFESHFYVSSYKRTLHDIDYFIDNGGMSKEAGEFLLKAYSSGVNILIGGETASGKTYFLNSLADSCKDSKPTILIHDIAEMSFSNDHNDITEFIANDCARLLQTATVLKPYRVIADGFYRDMTDEMNKAVDAGIQIVNTMHITPEADATGKLDQYSEYCPDNPFELRVDLKMGPKVDGKKRVVHVVGIHQLIDSTKSKGSKEVRTLFSGLSKISEPTRTLRRKMEAGLFNQPAAENSYESEPTRAYVSISEEEKNALMEDCAAIEAHLDKNKSLKERFENIVSFIAKF